MIKSTLILGALMALACFAASAAERSLGVIGLTATDTARVSVTHNDVEPLWIDIRYYDAEGILLKQERVTVRPKQIRFVELSGGEARLTATPGGGATRVSVRAAFSVVGSPDGTIVGDSEFASATLEVMDNLTGKSSFALIAAAKK